MTRAIGLSPARAEPHDAATWFPVPDPSALPSIDALLATSDPVVESGVEIIDLSALEAAVAPSPARAEPHDAAAWLPLPADVDALPALGALLEPHPEVTAAVVAEAEAVVTDAAAAAEAAVAPSPARAEPHDSASWLPLPDPASLVPLVELAPSSASDAPPPSRRVRAVRAARRPRTWALVVLATATAVGAVKVVGGPTTPAAVGATPVRVTVDLDGQVTHMETSARTATGLARELRVGKLVAVRQAPPTLSRGSYVVLRTRKSGQLEVDGQKLPFDSPSLTVAELLATSHVVLDGDDTSVPSPASVLVDGTDVKVVRVGAETKQTQEPLAFDTEMVADPTIDIGQTRVQRAGVPGVATVTWRSRMENGVEAGQTMLSRVTSTEPVSEIVGYGTRADWHWDALAQCESGGRWNTVDGGTPAYDGGLGILRQNWAHYGGLEYAPNAGLATREEQIVVAQRIYADYGWSPWGCARTLHWL